MIPSLLTSLEKAFVCVLHASWQAALLALLVLLVAWSLGDHLRPTWRFVLWLVVFARLALPVLPSAPWSVFRLVPGTTAEPTTARAVTVSLTDDLAAHPTTMDPVATAPGAIRHSGNSHIASTTDAVGRDAPAAAPSSAAEPQVILVHWLAAAWLLGVVLLLSRMVWAGFRLARRRREWREVTDECLLALFQACQRRLHVRRAVSLRIAGDDVGPATCGLARPCIVVPQSLVTSLSPEDLRFVLLHELVHVARRDVLLDRVAATIAAFHWFNPLAWLALACLRQERELACDAMLLARIGVQEARRYGHVLLNAVETLCSTVPASGVVGAFHWGSRHSLNRRIRMITTYRPPNARVRLLGWAALLLLAAVGLTDAQGEPARPEEEKPGQTQTQDTDTRQDPRSEAKPVEPRRDLYGDPLPAGADVRLGTMRLRHGGARLVFSPDSKTLVSFGYSEIRFWDPSDGRLLRTLAPREFNIQSVVFSPDGRSIAAGGYWRYPGDPSSKKKVMIWDAATLAERLVASFRGNDDVRGVGFVGDSSTVVVACDGVLHFWDVASGEKVLAVEIDKELKEIRRWVWSLAASPDGHTLAVVVYGKLYVWDWLARGLPRPLGIQNIGSVGASLAFSPGGKLLAALDDDPRFVSLYDVATGQRVRLLHGNQEKDGVQSVAYSPDGKLVAFHSYSSSAVLLVDPATGDEVRRIDGPAGVFSPDWRLLACSDGAGVRIRDVASGEPTLAERPWHTGGVRGGIAFTPDGSRVVTAADDNTVRTWDAATGRALAVLKHDGDVRGLAVSPDGRAVASSSTDDTVRLWDPADGSERYRLPGHGLDGWYKRPVAFTPDGTRLCTFGDDMYLRLWDVAKRELIVEHDLRPGGVNFRENPPGRHGPRIQAVGLSPDARRLGVAFQAAHEVPPGPPPLSIIYVWDVTGGELTSEFMVPDYVDWLTFSRDGKRLVTETSSKIRVSSLPAGEFELEIVAPTSYGAVILSADDSVVAFGVGGPERAIYLFDMANGRELQKIEGLPGDVQSLAFSTDGRRLAAGLDTGEGLIYDISAAVVAR